MRLISNYEADVLIDLARRVVKDTKYWAVCSDQDGKDLPIDFSRCLICNELVKRFPDRLLDKHGLNHLKEKGLLIFT